MCAHVCLYVCAVWVYEYGGCVCGVVVGVCVCVHALVHRLAVDNSVRSVSAVSLIPSVCDCAYAGVCVCVWVCVCVCVRVRSFETGNQNQVKTSLDMFCSQYMSNGQQAKERFAH